MKYGLMMLRTQVSADRILQALRVARTFDEAISAPRRVGQRDYRVSSPGWAIVTLQPSGVDMLLVGPVEAAGRVDDPDSLIAAMRQAVAAHDDAFITFVLPIQKLWSGWKDIRPIHIFRPPGERWSGSVSLDALRDHLELVDPRYRREQ
jgi:hypothetical protein